MMFYNWQQKDWPNFQYDVSLIEKELFLFAEKTGHVTGILKALPENTQTDAVIDMMVAEALKTSQIEGEFFSRKDVMSSIKNNLGLNQQAEQVLDKKADGIGRLMIAVRKTYKEALNEKKLFDWHKMLLDAVKGMETGVWRTHEEPMQVVSGALGKEKVHYEAPPSKQVPKEMEAFITWFNQTAPGGTQEMEKAVLRASIAHLYFESIHPFEDGNGRIGRAIAEKTLSQTLGRPVLLSLSKAIVSNKKDYYTNLQKAQQSNNINKWIKYFANVILAAQTDAEHQVNFILKKTQFFDRFKNQLSERQLKVLKRMLQEESGFEGGMNTAKYISLTKVSKATATRDLQDLLEKNVFQLLGDSGGRSTKYKVNI